VESLIPMTMGSGGASPEGLLAILGLNLPRVLGVNVVVEWIKIELQGAGLWTDESLWKRWFILAPFVVAIALCWLTERQPPGLAGIVSAVKCGAVYAMAAVTLNNLKRTAIGGR
jgi:hypothetical protein